MDRNQQRQNRRSAETSFSCTAGSELSPDVLPVGRTGAACDPAPAAPVALPVVPLVDCPPPPLVPLNLPDGLLVTSDAVSAFCPSTAGYSVTGTTAVSLSAGDQTQLVIFSGLANITENQLNYLFEVVPSSSAAIISASLSGATASVVDLTHLNYTQSEELIGNVKTAKTTINALAVEKARNLLVCQVENNLQAVSCPTGAYFGSTAIVPTSLEYIPSATAVTGSVLVPFALTPTAGDQAQFTLINIPSLTAAAAQANAIAYAQAQYSLRCIYGNDATAAACCTSSAPGNNLGYTAACVPDVGPTIPGSATAIGFFSVAANEIFSIVSKTAANQAARDLSRSSLNCYFPSEGVTATCVGLGLTAPFAPSSVTSVFLPPGSVILNDTYSSVTAANAQALAIANASLNCFWGNTAVSVTCPMSGTFTAINNLTYNLAPSVTLSPSYTAGLSANSVLSFISQADSDNLAYSLALASLSCIYCNVGVTATCTGGVNETIGVSGGVFCDAIAPVAQNTAISVGSILASSNDGVDCCFGNDVVKNTVFCEATRISELSADSFVLPANTITICGSYTGGVPSATSYYPYSNLFASTNSILACCSDLPSCNLPAGSVTALPVIWSDRTNLFDLISATATFYSSSAGAAYSFPNGFNYVVSRSSTSSRAFRPIKVPGASGGTAGTLISCTACVGPSYSNAYQLRYAPLSNYSSLFSLVSSLVCLNGGTGATFYTDSASPFLTASTSRWYTTSCGPGATFASSDVYGIYKEGTTGYILRFSETGSNVASFEGTTAACIGASIPYNVYVGSATCVSFTNTTLYSNIESAFTLNGGLTATFYTQQFNPSSTYSYNAGPTGYINYSAPGGVVFYRQINGSTARPAASCPTLNRYTVVYSFVSGTATKYYPAFEGSTAPFTSESSPTSSVFSNVRTVYSPLANAFASFSTGPAIFYEYPGTNLALNTPFIPGTGPSGPTYSIYLSPFLEQRVSGTATIVVPFTLSAGSTGTSTYREYTNYNTSSIGKTNVSVTGLGLTPVIQSPTGATANSTTAGKASGALFSVNTRAGYGDADLTNPAQRMVDALCNVALPAEYTPQPGIYFRPASNTSGPAGCSSGVLYSEIKDIFSACSGGRWPVEMDLKRVPYDTPFIITDNYASSANLSSYRTPLFYDNIGYKLSDSVTGTVGSNTIRCLDLTRIGAAFQNAIVKFEEPYIGFSINNSQEQNICPFIESIDYDTGTITLGGYFNKVISPIPANKPLYIVGMVARALQIDITRDANGVANSASNTFAMGPILSVTQQAIWDTLEDGHSLFSYTVNTVNNQINYAQGWVTSKSIYNNYRNVNYTSSVRELNNFGITGPGGGYNTSFYFYIYGKQHTFLYTDPSKFNGKIYRFKGPTPTSPGGPTPTISTGTYQPGIFKSGFYQDSYSLRYTTFITGTLGNGTRIVANSPYLVDTVNAQPKCLPVVTPYSYTAGPYYSTFLDGFYNNVYTFNCNNTYAYSQQLIPDTKVSWIATSCCDVITSINGSTATACEFYQKFGNTGVSAAAAVGGARVLQLNASANPYLDFLVVTVQNNSYSVVTEGVARVNEISRAALNTGMTGGPFVRFNYTTDSIVHTASVTQSAYNNINYIPCNAKDATGIYYRGSATGSLTAGWTGPWSRKYIGYFNATDPVYPIYPADSGTAISSTAYFANKNYVGVTAVEGFVFREYDPDFSSTACNCGNYIPVTYSLTSGNKYSFWPSLTAAWTALPIVPWMSSATLETPIGYFNACASGCESNPIGCISWNICSGTEVASNFSARESGLEFVASEYDIESPFNFSDMPAVGSSAAADLKATANTIAQNLVNSFVRCMYGNTPKTGKECSIGEITLSQGGVGSAEVLSPLSQAEADRQAQVIADSRTVCFNPDEQGGGGGCEGTRIKDTERLRTPIGYFDLKFERSKCSFTPTLSLTESNLKWQSGQVIKFAICTGGGTKTYLFPVFEESSDLADGSVVKIAFAENLEFN